MVEQVASGNATAFLCFARFPVAEIPEPNAKTNKAVEPTAIRWLFDYF
jgi:hypothetical protein